MIVGYEIEDIRLDNRVCQWDLKCDCNKNHKVHIELDDYIGNYTLAFDVPSSQTSNQAIIYLNGEEVGAFAVPYTGKIDEFGRYKPIHAAFLEEDKQEFSQIYQKYREEDTPIRSYRFEVPLICKEGPTRIEVHCEASCLNASMKTYNGDGFWVERAILYRGIKKPESLFERVRPGKSLIDLWGWMSMTNFEHPGNRVTPFEEQTIRGILEPYKWGANNFEFLPVNSDGMAVDLRNEQEWEGKNSYIQSRDSTWNSEAVIRLVQTAKQHGMLVEFFLYALHGAEFVAKNMKNIEKQNLFEKIVKNYSNMLECSDRSAIIDGIITEAWFPIDGPNYINRAWRWNSSFFHLLSNNDGSQFEVHDAGYTPATHAYSAHWPGFDTQHTGYDHCYPLIPYPKEFYQRENGTLYTYMQGCGQTMHPRKKFPREMDIPLGITNRTVSPDWIIAQTHNYGFRNLMDKNDHLAMAIGWEADEETMCPKDARRYVYAASQDPIRLSTAYQLEDTGSGGEIELKRSTRKVNPFDKTRLRKRHKFPSSTIANSNRFLQTLFLHNRDYTLLQCDLTNTGTFYNHGAVANLAMPFIITRFEDCRYLEKNITIVEAAGPKSVVRETSTMGSGYVSFQQVANYSSYSDIPLIHTMLQRSMEPGMSETITTIMGFVDYDRCSKKESFYKLTDSKNQLPEVLIYISSQSGSITFEQGKGLLIKSHLIGDQRIEIITFVKTGDFENVRDEDILGYIAGSVITTKFTNDESELCVQNTSLLDGPIILKIEHAEQDPYYVLENGIWQHRGATPSQEKVGCDYLKLYLKAGEKGAVRKYGYLDGVLKPGRGCQNILGFSEINADGNRVTCRILMEPTNPMIGSPVIEVAKTIEAVKLDGKDYYYFDEDCVILPQDKKEVKLEIIFGNCVRPRLISAYGNIIQCSQTEKDDQLVMIIEQAHPDWVNKAPYDTPYTAIIDIGEYTLEKTSIAEQNRMQIELPIGVTKLNFVKVV